MTRPDTTVLRVQQLGKGYKLYPSPRARLKALLWGDAPDQRVHWVLRGVDFELKRGQCMGVVGNNGAGKSSLLKLIAGTLQPSEGEVLRRGRVTAILELGAGFHPDFSGRDNLFFGGRLIGIEEAQMRELADSIIAFSELGEAIDRPVKSYSSGMVVRLAFALVTAVEPEVLIIDEALAVGDQHFQKKCVERIEAFRRNGCTILFCSHSLYHVRHLCDVAIWLDAGQVKSLGPTEEVLADYESHVRRQDALDGMDLAPLEPQAASVAVPERAGGVASTPSTPAPQPLQGTRAEITALTVEGLDGGAMGGATELPRLRQKDLVVTVQARAIDKAAPHFGVMLEQAKGTGITSVTTHNDGATATHLGDDLWSATVTFTDLPLFSGEYVLSAYLFDSNGLVVYDEWKQCRHFRVVHPSRLPGLLQLPHQWS